MIPSRPSPSSFRSTLSQLELRYPPLPQTLLEAMHLMDAPEQLEVGPVTEMVQHDPFVVARLLQIVNSAYYGLQRSIDSIERAVVMLGPVAVTGIVLGMNMLRLRSALEGPAAGCFSRLIRHSIATAFLTRHLLEGPPHGGYRRPALRRTGTAFTAGLLHDFGKIVLVYNFPQEAVDLYEQNTLSEHIVEQDIRSLEQVLFGYDHTEAGEYVARKLGFPEPLVQVIRRHHDPLPDAITDDTHLLVVATMAANLMAKTLGYGFTHDVSPGDCRRHPVWTRLLDAAPFPYSSPDELIDGLAAQREHLDHYVSNMTMGPVDGPRRTARPSSRFPGSNLPIV
ncbi:MAG: HD family phosphohydrolase [Rhodothermaceae bacterium]|nr:MAG: HD family phosphohydrolase [Rhodothermaceae bacterium]